MLHPIRVNTAEPIGAKHASPLQVAHLLHSPSMNWRNIILFSLLSLPVTLLAIYGIIPTATVEAIVWLALVLILAWLLRTSPRPFLSGLVTGLLMGLWSHLLSIPLWDAYVANNPEMSAEILTGAAEKGMSLPTFMLVLAPTVGLMYGLVLGLLAWGASKLGKDGARPAGARTSS